MALNTQEVSSKTATVPPEMLKFLAGSGIPYMVPSEVSPEAFSKEHELWVYPFLSAPNHAPTAVAKPRDTKDIEALVSACRDTKTPFSVRGGGHDLFRRCIVNGALLIDVRTLNSVKVAEDKQTAVIGGGAINIEMADELEKEGVTTAIGGCGQVGWTGWATLGGYGGQSTRFGLGVDQIIGATIVGADGKAKAAEGDVLRAIRGAGGNFGVIVDLTIKVYPLEPVYYASLPMAMKNPGEDYISLLAGLEKIQAEEPGLPSNLFAMTTHSQIPGGEWVCFLHTLWHGEIEGQEDTYEDWIKRLASTGTCTAPEGPVKYMKKTTARAFTEFVLKMLPDITHGGAESVTVSNYTKEVLDIIKAANDDFPKPGDENGGQFLHSGGFVVHRVDRRSPSAAAEMRKESVYPCREEHIVVEFASFCGTAEAAAESKAWARKWAAELRKVPVYIKAGYVSLTDQDAVSVEEIYGVEELAWLKALKAKEDPEGLFNNAIPRLG